MARSRLPLSVSPGGASSSMRACSSLSAGVSPSLALVTLGRFTPLTGLCTTALRSQRYSKRDETAESLRRIVDPSFPLPSRSLRQPMRCARVTTRNTSGFEMRAKRMKSLRSFWYARRVRGFVMFANHSISGGTSARSRNSFAESARAFVGIRARDDFLLDAIDEFDLDVNNGMSSLTPIGMLWTNMALKIASAFTPDKTPYQG